MTQEEIKARKYFETARSGMMGGLYFHDALKHEYWSDYIRCVGTLMSLDFTPRTCVRRAKKAHAKMSDYINKK